MSSANTDSEATQDDLPYFRGFRNVISLTVPALNRLSLGYSTPSFGTAYQGPKVQVDRLRERLRKDADAARQRAKRVTRNVFPRLQTLRISGETYDFTRLKTDNVDELDRLEMEKNSDKFLYVK